jgi:fermentation-respiration switch protein FrsA (DUF1100 family)
MRCIETLAFLVLAALGGCSPRGSDRPASLPSATADEPSALPESSTAVNGGVPSATPSMPDKPEASTPKKQAARTLDELLLFFPSKYPSGDWKPEGLRLEDAWFAAADGTRLHGWYCPCEKPRAVLLYAHGNAGNLAGRAPLMRYLQKELRVRALIFDYRGYGRSEGIPSAAGILQDGRAARAFLASQAGVKEAEIVLMGRSLGGGVVAQLAGEARPRGLILESTFSSLRDVASHHYPCLSWMVPTKKLDSVAALARYAGPLLQSHGDADRTIPYALGRKLFDTAKGPKRFVRISGGDHNDPPSAEYRKELNRFISELP